MKLSVRAKMLRAMEYVARAVNNEDVFETWLLDGVADGDIDGTEIDEELSDYCDDKHFADIMQIFLELMSDAEKDGGLFIDGVVSKHTGYWKD